MENAASRGFYKLSWLQRIGFGSGDLAQNLIYQTISMYLLMFYTNVYGLDPSAAAFMFLIVRVVDVIWDPVVGTYVDKHNPRFGKYRSYLLLAGVPLTASPYYVSGMLLRVFALCIHHLCGHVYALHSDKCALWRA